MNLGRKKSDKYSSTTKPSGTESEACFGRGISRGGLFADLV